MQSQASPNGSLASPGWQPFLLPGLPSRGKRGKHPAAPETLSVTERHSAGQPAVILHWPTSPACVSRVGCTVAIVPVMGSGQSVKTAS